MIALAPRLNGSASLRRLSVGLLALALLALASYLQPFFNLVPSSQAVSTTVVIGEFRTRGPSGGNDEFIELYNLSSTDVDISGWKINGSNNAGTTGTRATIPAGKIIKAGCRYLLTNNNSTGPYSGSVTGDQTYTTGIGDDGGIALLNASNVIIDQVGMSTGSAYKEGTFLTPLTTNTDRSYERKPGGASGSTTDTDNNSSDFQVRTPSDPQNSANGCTGITNQAITTNCPGTLSTPQGSATSANVSATDPDGTVTSATITSVSVPGITLDNFVASSGVGQPATATLNVANTTAAGEYSVTIQYSNNDSPTPQTATCTIQVSVIPANPFIHDIQGSTETPHFIGSSLTIRGVVTGDYQGAANLNGFYVEEEDADWDADPATSEGIFVFQSSTSPTTDVNIGDDVTITGVVSNFPSNTAGLTELTASAIIVNATAATLPTAVTPPLPVPTSADVDLERFEGMRVTFPQTLYVTEVFNLGSFGEVTVTPSAPQFVPTNFVDPNDNPASGTNITGSTNVAAVTAQQSLNNRSQLIIDDGTSRTNTSATNPLTPIPYLLPSGTLRRGDILTGATGVMDYRFSTYRMQPAPTLTFTQGNPRPAAPSAIGSGNVRLASFNVDNYFVTTGTGRGASNATELTRQRDKIVAALEGLNADVIGLIELEKANGNAAAADLANALNAKLVADGLPGHYTAVADLSTLNGTDADIKNGMIYRDTTVTAFGTSFTDTVAAAGTYSRDPLAQIFKLNSNGRAFTVVVHHARSKSCTGATGLDADQGDGQSCFNDRRRKQSQALMSFVNSVVPTTADILVVGDFNAYAEEDPIDVLRAGGLQDVMDAYVPAASKYSFTFQGQAGQLDHALATSSLSQRATGATIWHIDSDEPPILDYTTANKPDDRYQPTPYRASDHDPIVTSFNLALPTAADTDVSGQITTLDGQPLGGVIVQLSGASSARTITDAQGNYRFENMQAGGFYTVRPERADYSFSPAERSFSLTAKRADAVFTATANSNATSNPLDSDLFFIRQQYLDFLGREPDAGGLAYWASELDKCGSDVPCLNSRRTAIAAAFFKELEYQRTGSFLYRIYKGALGRRVSFDEFSTDRASVIDGPALESSKSAYAEQFVRRADFQQKYSEATSAESFVDALISNIKQTSTADLSNQRSSLIESYRSGADINQSRALALRAAIDSGAFTEAEYNPSFVLMEYFGYLKREPEEGGYQFWLNVLNNREPGNYNGMVCSFITSTEYQSRFAGYIAHSNRECSR